MQGDDLSAKTGTNPSGVVMTLGVVAIILLIGGVTIGSVSNDYQDRNDALESRGQEVYGDDYQIVTSDNCYETCIPTATTVELRRQAILIEADRNVEWTSDITLGKAVAGPSVEDTADSLVEEGLLEKRDSNGILGMEEYRYVGPEGEYEDGLSDEKLRQLLRQRLYVTGTWMSMDEIVSSVPAVEWRVRKELGDLQESGIVKAGTESQSPFIPFGGHTAYAHSSVDHPPAGSNSGFDLFIVASIVGGIAIALTSVQKWRRDGGQEKSSPQKGKRS